MTLLALTLFESHPEVISAMVFILQVLVATLVAVLTAYFKREVEMLRRADAEERSERSELEKRVRSEIATVFGRLSAVGERFDRVDAAAADRRVAIAALEAHYTEISRRLDQMGSELRELNRLVREVVHRRRATDHAGHGE